MNRVVAFLFPLYFKPNVSSLEVKYSNELQASSTSQTSYASEDNYLSISKAAFEKEEARYASLRANATASVTLALTLLAGFVAFGDQYPPISKFGEDPAFREIGFLVAVVVAGLYILASLYHALRALGATPRNLLGPVEFLPSAHMRHTAERDQTGMRPLGYSEWLAAAYTEATIANYVVDASIALRVRLAMRAVGISLMLLVLTTLINTITQEDPSKDTIVCIVDSPSSAELCPKAN